MIDRTITAITAMADAIERYLFPKGKPLPEAKHAPPLPTAKRAPAKPTPAHWLAPLIRKATLTPRKASAVDLSLDADPTPPAKAQPRQMPPPQPPRAPPKQESRPMMPTLKIDVAGAYQSATIAREEAGKLAIAMGFRLRQSADSKKKQIILTTGGVRNHNTWRAAFDWLHACYLDRQAKIGAKK